MEKDKDPNQAIRVAERADYKSRAKVVGEILFPYFQNTALVLERNWQRQDLEDVKEAFIAAAPHFHPKVFPSYVSHIILASIYARKIAEQVNDLGINPTEMEVLGLIHDIGKIVIPHRYLRANMFEELFLRRLNVRVRLLQKFYNIPAVLGISFRESPKIDNISQMNMEQIIEDVADNLGKLNNDGSMFTVEQFREYDTGQAKRYAGGVWPSQRRGLWALTEGGKQFETTQMTLQEIDLLSEKYGINFDDLKDEVFQEFEQPEAQEWVSRMMAGLSQHSN